MAPPATSAPSMAGERRYEADAEALPPATADDAGTGTGGMRGEGDGPGLRYGPPVAHASSAAAALPARARALLVEDTRPFPAAAPAAKIMDCLRRSTCRCSSRWACRRWSRQRRTRKTSR